LQANGPHKQGGVATLISNKVDFRLKSIRRVNEGHFILIEGKFIKRKYQCLTYMHQTQGHTSTLKKKPLIALRAEIDPDTVIGITEYPTVINR
jgi:hypothetical protein